MYYHKTNVRQVIYFTTAITVRFDQSTYSVNEDAGPSQPVLVLSNIASFPITVQVVNTDRTATGE